MKGINLTKSTCEKDLGVILSLDLKPEKYIGLVVGKSSNTLWPLTHFLRYLDLHSKISAYTNLINYCEFMSPHKTLTLHLSFPCRFTPFFFVNGLTFSIVLNKTANPSIH